MCVQMCAYVYAYVYMSCACMCMCVHVCVCVCEGKCEEAREGGRDHLNPDNQRHREQNLALCCSFKRDSVHRQTTVACSH